MNVGAVVVKLLNKKNMMAKKTKRWALRVTPDLDQRVRELSESLIFNKSKNQLIENILSDVALSPEKIFVCCPDCGSPMFNPEWIPILEGVQEVTCANNHTNVWSWSENEFLFPKP